MLILTILCVITAFMEERIVGGPYCTILADIQQRVLRFDTEKHDP